MLKHALSAVLLLMLGCSTCLDPKPANKLGLTESSAHTVIFTPANTRITFIGSALLISHEGSFNWYAGRIDVPTNDPKDARILAEVEMNSVFTKIELLTQHLKSPEFFDVTQYPTAAFVSTSIQPKPDSNTDCIITGNLTLHGVQKSLAFPAHFELTPKKISLNATFTVRQSDFGMASARTTTDDVPVTVTATLPRP